MRLIDTINRHSPFACRLIGGMISCMGILTFFLLEFHIGVLNTPRYPLAHVLWGFTCPWLFIMVGGSVNAIQWGFVFTLSQEIFHEFITDPFQLERYQINWEQLTYFSIGILLTRLLYLWIAHHHCPKAIAYHHWLPSYYR